MTDEQERRLERVLAPNVQEIIDYMQDILAPEDVFSEDQLKDWAEKNGYIEDDGQ